MNTEQKAREWLALMDCFIALTLTEEEAREIITALLAERQALLDAARLILLEPHGCPMCDSGKLRSDKPHWDTCGFNAAQQAIAMCEGQNNE